MATTEPRPTAAPGTGPAPGTDEHRADVDRAEAALLDPAMAPLVEVVLRRTGDDTYEAASVDGRARIRREATGRGWRFTSEVLSGRDPLADQATDRFAPLDDERANPFPDRSANSYPYAHEQVAQLFDHLAAPDLVAIHTSAHNWEDEGGHRGEHGSIDVVQARAPFILAGPGVAARGLVPEACRLVDVAPTVLALLGVEPGPGVGLDGSRRDDVLLARQDGEVQSGLLDPAGGRPDNVIGFLVDGANANVLYDAAARGEAPNVARLMAMGTALGHGAMSSLPTVTLANHTAILTGAHPGHHGILNNAWWDRARSEQVITNSPSTWITSMTGLSAGIESMHDVVHQARPGSFTASINEPCDVGADYSTFGVMRAGGTIDRPPPIEELPHTSQMFVRPVKEYKWSTLVDHTSVTQFVEVWEGRDGNPPPTFAWVNFSLTDAAFHEGGPYSDIAQASIRDTDARLGEVLDAVERSGRFDRTAFFLVADHGMEETDPTVQGNWSAALDECGVSYRDEAYGFLYVHP